MDLQNTGENISFGNDGIIIQSVLEAIPGGKSLDVTGYTPLVVPAGHVVIREDSNGIIKVHPVSGATYAATPASHTIIGVTIASVKTSRAMVGIMTKGRVNKNAVTYPYLAGHLTALQPNITFAQDVV